MIVDVALLGWLPVTLALFSFVNPRRAVLFSAVGAILVLPSAGMELPGLPGVWDRYSAFALSSLIGIAIFDSARLFSLRPRAFDLFALVLVLSPLPTALANGLGAYEGGSNVYRHIVLYGLPYFYGRVYITTGPAMRELALAIVIGAILYAPLSLFEIRMSPQLHNWVYGFHTIRFVMFRRFGGFRPIVFMDSPLMLGMWMAAGAILTVWLAARLKNQRVAGVPLTWLLPLPVAALLLGKTMAAISIFVMATGVLWSAVYFRTRIVLILLVVGFMSYPALRTTQVLNRDTVIAVVKPIFPPTRVASLDYRLVNEDRFILKALEQPVFGWGGRGRNRTDDSGAIDGLWIITLGKQGITGLVSLMGLFLVPVWLLARRLPARRWGHPIAAPVAGVGAVIAVYWIDCLSNAFVNPVYLMAMGGLNTVLGTPALRSLFPPDVPPSETSKPEGPAPSPPTRGGRMADLVGSRRRVPTR